jgi:glutathione S-transferase
MALVDVVIVLALLQYLAFGVLVGRGRGQYGVAAPAITGHEVFERLYRVHMNTLELLVVLVPALWMAARYWSPTWVACAGAVYLVGRVVYWRAYVKAPASRTLGYAMSFIPTVGLLLAALVGAVRQG